MDKFNSIFSLYKFANNFVESYIYKFGKDFVQIYSSILLMKILSMKL
jgi:hypothetical protein